MGSVDRVAAASGRVGRRWWPLQPAASATTTGERWARSSRHQLTNNTSPPRRALHRKRLNLTTPAGARGSGLLEQVKPASPAQVRERVDELALAGISEVVYQPVDPTSAVISSVRGRGVGLRGWAAAGCSSKSGSLTPQLGEDPVLWAEVELILVAAPAAEPLVGVAVAGLQPKLRPPVELP